MNGDFSNWRFDERTNSNGVLQQQGRVLTDADWNQQARLSLRWRDEAARAAFGSRVAAVAKAWGDSFLVSKATAAAGGAIELELNPGQVWADGLLTYLRSSDIAAPGALEIRPASHLGAAAGGAPGTGGTRDAVILEVWREALNAFQVPHEMLEPALGGVDTTERVWHGLRFHLVRLAAGEDCKDAADRVKDDLSNRGRLSVSLEPSVTTAGPCPVVVGGGYTGFEHNQYRIEIANVDGGDAMFKWSQFNGGLVGRATFDAVTQKAKIRANRQPILRSGLQSFYIEVFEPLPDRPQQPAAPDLEDSTELAEEWRLVYGGRAVLASDEEIDLTETKFGAIPADPNQSLFFRLWNDLRPIADFDSAPAVELGDGIHLHFTGGGAYNPGDYWTFPVRAGEVATAEPLIDDEPPEGIERVRVPLAILNWTGAASITHAAKEIEDCRKVFPPLSDLPPGCCVPVHPGEDLHAKIKKLRKAGGGCLCLLPGEHVLDKPLDLSGASNIHIKGFGLASRVLARGKAGNAPVFDLSRASGMAFHDFAVLNRRLGPIFFGSSTRDLALSGLFLASAFIRDGASIVTIGNTRCSDWRVDRNVFLGASGIFGPRLNHSRIADNYFAGIVFGLRLSDLFAVHVERNRFLGIPVATSDGFNNTLSGAVPAGGTFTRDFFGAVSDAGADSGLKEQSEAILARLEQAARASDRTRYDAIRVSGLLDSRVAWNNIVGRNAVFAEMVENSSVQANRFLTTVGGAGFGLVHGLDFSDNRIGEKRIIGQRIHLAPRVGLRLLLDVVGCRITGNSFLDVNEAIVFESDRSGRRNVVRDVEANLKAAARGREAVGAEEVIAFLANAEEDAREHRLETRVLASSFFSVGKCERTLIEGNTIRADSVGIEWSGTKDIVDFRISRNAFAGCRGGAILIEPDDRVHFLAEGVDTKVRLIERNRFDVRGVAVRSTIGAVRVARNDIRLRAPRATVLSAGEFIGATEFGLVANANFNAAAKKRDVANVRILAKDAVMAAEAAPETTDTTLFHERAEADFLATRKLYSGDAMADNLNLMSKLALADRAPLMIVGFGAFLAPAIASLEGFAVNLGGIQNEIVDNNLLSDNSEFDGGAVLHLPSGVVTGNEMQVGRTAVLVNSKSGQARDTLRVEGNTLRVTGPPRGDGKRSAAYALSIPTLTPGNYAILDNHLDGSVMVGAEPFASSGLVKKDRLDMPLIATYYHALAFDESSYASSLMYYNMPAKDVQATPIEADVINGLLVGFLADIFQTDPHKDRAVIQFADNRVVRGYVALARSTGGAFWTKETLQAQASTAPVIEVNGNVFDYWARVVGRDVILVGNHSQTPILFRNGNAVERVANIPAAAGF